MFKIVASAAVAALTAFQVQGRNNTVLFLVNMLGGLHNVHLATIQSLQENYPGLELHVASWNPVGNSLKRVSGAVAAKPVEFHALTNQSYLEAVYRNTGAVNIADFIHSPGPASALQFGNIMQGWMSPWLGPEYLALVKEMSSLIDTIDPAVVVLDVMLHPGINAVRETNRLHAFIVPNPLIDMFSFAQPWGGAFWKYPTLGSRLPFPIPWLQIPENIWHSVRMWHQLSKTPNLRKTKAYLRANGIRSGYGDFFNIHRPDTPWITQELPGASLPADTVPRNVTRAGPINIRVAPVSKQDPELASWLARGPTILVNLGGNVRYDEQRATVMTKTLSSLLDERADIQVLWKFQKLIEYPDDFKSIAKDHLASGRLRMVPWLDVDPFAILETGHITAFVHHGGAGSYHEGVSAGVPHVVFPFWGDHYNFATLVEYLKIGVWGCRETAPEWNSGCILKSISSVIDSGAKGQSIRENAARVGEAATRSPGRDGAAKVVAKLAASGRL
ncbi:family 1 glycosyltransferase [Thozetella sp. PMI_491]|nr:family 1 glycosyltransferase [Thozetella sp. PMI_491]